MSLKTRIDKAEAEWIARVQAERKAVVFALEDWLRANSTPAEYDAHTRAFFAAHIGAALERQAAGAALSEGERAVLDIHAEVGPPGPDDGAIAEALDARIPPALIERLKAAIAVRLPGESEDPERAEQGA